MPNPNTNGIDLPLTIAVLKRHLNRAKNTEALGDEPGAELAALVSDTEAVLLNLSGHVTPAKEVKVYLSGPMTGHPDLNFPAFHSAAAKIRGMGFDVINPAELVSDKNAKHADCMRVDIKALCGCDVLVTLPCSADEAWASRGMTAEIYNAKIFGMPILSFEDTSGLRALLGVKTAQPEAGDWIEWPGGDCPVDFYARIDVKFRNGGFSYNQRADLFLWGPASPVSAYRLSKQGGAE